MDELTLDSVRRRVVQTIQRTITGTDYKVPVAAMTEALMADLRPELEELMRSREGIRSNPEMVYRPPTPSLVYHHSDGKALTNVDRVDWTRQAPLDGREIAILRALLQWSMDNLEEADG